MKGLILTMKLVVTMVVIILGTPEVVLAGAPGYLGDPEVTVSFVDLNLATEKGVRTLYRRLQHASEEVCGVSSLTTFGSVYRLTKTSQCYRDALSNAVDKVGSERLREIHAE